MIKIDNSAAGDGYTVTAADEANSDLNQIATELAKDVDGLSDFTAGVENNIVVITRFDGSSFAVVLEIDAAAESSVSINNVNSEKTRKIALVGPVNDGDKWVLTINNGSGTFDVGTGFVATATAAAAATGSSTWASSATSGPTTATPASARPTA